MTKLHTTGFLGPFLLAALLGLGATSVLGQAPSGAGFAVTDHPFFLSAERGGAAGQGDVLLLVADPPAGQETLPFVAPGVDLLGLVQRQGSEVWYSQDLWDKDLELVDDVTAVLYFAANPQGLAAVDVRLYDVAADGQADLVASQQREFVTLLSGSAERFELAAAGHRLPKGHVLALEVAVETPSAAAALQYGGDTPSALVGVATRWLDSDGDGLADSDETLVGRNPLDADDGASVAFADGDGDGLSDESEAGAGTDPARVDSDGDSWLDGLEAHAGSDPLNPASVPLDEDGDTLPDNYESAYFGSFEQDAAGDPDGDGCDNLREAVSGTSPVAADTDGDGVGDCAELDDGTDPANAASVVSGPGGVPEPVVTAAFFAIGSSLCLLPFIRRT